MYSMLPLCDKKNVGLASLQPSAMNKAHKNILIYKSEDIPWQIKCRRLVDQVFPVFSFGSENWSWTMKTVERINGWETETMLRLFRFIRKRRRKWIDYYARDCKTARKIWVQMGLPFLYEVIAESMWRAMGWVCDERPNAVINTLRSVFRWRNSRWWQSTQARGMKEEEVAQSWKCLGQNCHGLGG